jgi:hypothetical protein
MRTTRVVGNRQRGVRCQNAADDCAYLPVVLDVEQASVGERGRRGHGAEPCDLASD